jgi:hypothetical protein
MSDEPAGDRAERPADERSLSRVPTGATNQCAGGRANAAAS